MIFDMLIENKQNTIIMKNLVICLIIAIVSLGCETSSIDPTPKQVFTLQGAYIESDIDLAHMSPVRILITEDSIYRGLDQFPFVAAERGAYILADTIRVEFRSYGSKRIGTGEGVFENFRIESEFIWNKDSLIFSKSYWKADGWSGLEYNSLFTKTETN